MKPNYGSRLWFPLLLVLAAAAAPLGAALFIRLIPETSGRFEYLSVATLSALVIGQLVGLRRARLGSFLAGPAVGFAAGLFDLKVFGWLYSVAGWPIGSAALVPVWGAVLGLWIASFSQRWWSGVLRFVTITGSDFAARFVWSYLAAHGLFESLGDWRWLAEPLVYIPTAVLIIALTTTPPTPAAGDDRRRGIAGVRQGR